MKLHCGLDLHSNNTYVGIIDQNGKRVVRTKLKNVPENILHFLDPYKEDLASIVVESTYNWYWLVDYLWMKNTRFTLPTHPRYKNIQDSNIPMIPMMRSG